jgi:3-hydroxybutyryl-CoA dehydratase
MTPVEIGEQITAQIVLTKEEIATFATLCGDLNPLHHDESYARQTRFGGIIACGPHITSLMMGLTATHFSRSGAMLGLEFTFRFRKPVKADEQIDMEWEIVAIEPKASLQGSLVSLRGKATNPQGQDVLTGTGKILATEKL